MKMEIMVDWEPVYARIIKAMFNSRWRQVTITHCCAPTNKAAEEAKVDFYEQVQAVLEQVVPSRDVKIVMGDFNAKVRADTTGREELMGGHGAKSEMNDNGEMLADFCQVNEKKKEETTL